MRGVPRWLAVLAVVAIATILSTVTVRWMLAPSSFYTQVTENTLPADGFASTELTIHAGYRRHLQGLQVEAVTPHHASVDSLNIAGTTATASLRAGVLPGEAKFKITVPGFSPQLLSLRTTLDTGDSIGDGTPDFLRLHDRADRMAFRRWFSLLTESQFYLGKAHLPEINDCAALLRFSYREALREHDATWARRLALSVPSPAPDVRQYQYPYTPLGASLFRVRDGTFNEADLHNGAFAEFADAETLWKHNTFSVGRTLDNAQPGDLIFFRQDDGGRMPFHAMIFVGRSQVERGSEEFVIYHTGPNGKLPGEIKRLSLTQLLDYPDERWRPLASNPAFLGVYRWNILRGGE